MTWHQNLLVLLSLVGVAMFIATGLALMGYWPMLPFAGFDVLAVAAAFYLVALRGRDRELITIDQETLVVEKGRAFPRQRWRFKRAWVRIELLELSHKRQREILRIGESGNYVDVGDFLLSADREQLARDLRARTRELVPGQSAE